MVTLPHRRKAFRAGLAPLALSVTCLQYLRAQRLVEVGGTDGSGISTWEDEAGTLDAAQGTGSAQPVLKTAIHNGRAVARFDITDDFMTHTAFNSSSCWIVLRPTNITKNVCYISASSGRGFFVDSNVLTAGPGMFDGTNGRWANNSNRITSGSLVSLLMTPTKVYRNGVEVSGYGSTGTPSATSVSRINGRPDIPTLSNMAFDLCEIAHFNGSPSAADVALLLAHAQSYYGAP